jgi:hypothetical protein
MTLSNWNGFLEKELNCKSQFSLKTQNTETFSSVCYDFSCLNVAVAVTNDTECFELIFGKELICKCKYSIKTHNTETFSRLCYDFSRLNAELAITNDTGYYE